MVGARKCATERNLVAKWDNFLPVFVNRERKAIIVKPTVHIYLYSFSILDNILVTITNIIIIYHWQCKFRKNGWYSFSYFSCLCLKQNICSQLKGAHLILSNIDFIFLLINFLTFLYLYVVIYCPCQCRIVYFEWGACKQLIPNKLFLKPFNVPISQTKICPLEVKSCPSV